MSFVGRSKKLVVFVACVALALASLPVTASAKEPTSPSAGAPRVPGEVVVQFARTSSPSSRMAARSSLDVRGRDLLGPPGLELVELGDMSVSDAIARLEARPDVIYAEPNYVVEAQALPNDPLFANQWSLHDAVGDVDLDAPEAWDTTKGVSGTVVAIVDTGVAWDHPDLAANVWVNDGESGSAASNGVDDDANGFVDDVRGWDWVDDDNDPIDISGHGTHVAGTVAARGDNGVGVTGIAWNTRILPLRVLGASGEGGSADVARAFWYAADAGADVVNASFGSSGFSQAMSDAVSQNPDVLFVAAAGNAGTDNDQTSMWPCNLPHQNMVCVTAVGRDNARPGFANFGPTSVDIAAPGTSILSASPDLSYPLGEDFEVDAGSRWASGGTATWGPVQGANGIGYSDSPSGSYASHADTWLVTRAPIDTSGARGCGVTYRVKLDVPRGDSFSVETSTDGSTWRSTGSLYGTTDGAWETMGVDLDRVGGPLYLRFRLRSDDKTTDDGVAIDNVSVHCAVSDYGPTHYSYASGTSMATPHVSGIAALLFSVAPDATVASVRDALFEGSVPVPSLSGLIATPGRVNAAAALAIITGTVPGPEITPPPGVEVTPTPVTTALPEPDPTIEPDPVVTPEPEMTEHQRALVTKLVRGPRLRGKVSSADAYRPCIDGAQVVIRRNGRVLKSAITDPSGRFSVKVPSRRGRYRSIVMTTSPTEGHTCTAAVSVS